MSILEKVFSKIAANVNFRFILLSATVVLFLHLLKKFIRTKRLQAKIPSLKLGCLNVTGHLALISRGTASYQLYPLHVYILQILEGLCVLHRKKDFFIFWMANIPFVILHKAAAVEELFKSTVVLEKAWSYNTLHPWLGNGLLVSKGPKWKSRRKILTPSFHFDILKDFLPTFNEKSKILVDLWKTATSKEWIDITEPLTLCSLDIICETTLGVNVEAQTNEDSEYVKALLRVSETTLERIFSPKYWLDFVFFRLKIGQQYSKDLNILHSFTKNIIRKKKNALKLNGDQTETTVKPKRQALMNLLLNHHLANESFTEDDVQEEVDTFAFEGHDTTATGLSWSLFLIGQYPHIQKKIHEELDMIFGDDDRYITTEDLSELKYLQCVIKEAQRIYPSVPFIGREVVEDFNLGGKLIPKGSVLAPLIYSLHRDSVVFPNPETFDPERFSSENSVGRHPYAYVPFAAGPRNCIGQRFAMMELKVVLATVLRAYTVQSLDPRDKVLPALGLVLRTADPVRMKLVSRKQ